MLHLNIKSIITMKNWSEAVSSVTEQAAAADKSEISSPR